MKYQLHGAQSIPFQPPLDYYGGIFGGPSVTPRQGIFKVHFAMPEWVRRDNTIGGPMDLRENLPDRCIRPGGLPTVGLRDVDEATIIGSNTMRSPWVWAGIIGLSALALLSMGR
jgi:hypothetical protein